MKKDTEDKTKTKKMRRNLHLSVNKDVFEEFRLGSIEFFVKEKKMQHLNNANFMKVCIHNIERIFFKKYSEILPISEEFESFYVKGGRGTVEQAQYYNHTNKKSFFIALEDEDYYKKYFQLMHTFYIKELKPKGFTKYSINYFFYDMFNIVKESIKDFENTEQLK